MIYDILKFLHIMSFVFMSVPLFNLIVVNERAKFGPNLNYYTDNYMENIIRGGVKRCFTFQTSVLITGVLLLIFGPLGIGALLNNWILAAKTLLLFTLMGLLSYVHLSIQPQIDRSLKDVKSEVPIPEEILTRIKPYRIRRKKLAGYCLFLVIITIILGLQVYGTFNPMLTIGLVTLAALFSYRAYKNAIIYGWI